MWATYVVEYIGSWIYVPNIDICQRIESSGGNGREMGGRRRGGAAAGDGQYVTDSTSCPRRYGGWLSTSGGDADCDKHSELDHSCVCLMMCELEARRKEGRKEKRE